MTRPTPIPASNSNVRKAANPDPLSRYFVAHDAAGDLAIWREAEPSDPYPVAVAHARTFRYAPELWDVLVAAVEAR